MTDYVLSPVCFRRCHHFFISSEIKPTSEQQRTSASMTRTSSRHVRPSKKSRTHHYRPRRVKMTDLRTKPVTTPPREIYVTSPFYEQMEYGEKTVEARPNYKLPKFEGYSSWDCGGIHESFHTVFDPCTDHQQTTSSRLCNYATERNY